LTVVTTPSGGVNSVFDLNRLLASWGEGNGSDHRGTPGDAGEATWNNRFGPGTPWVTPGGDFLSTPSASRSVAGNGAYAFNSITGLVSDVQRWVNDPASNFGWLLRSESETTPTTIRRFGARTDVANSPVLSLSYSVPPRLENTLARQEDSNSSFKRLQAGATWSSGGRAWMQDCGRPSRTFHLRLWIPMCSLPIWQAAAMRSIVFDSHEQRDGCSVPSQGSLHT
jgi:hypothetical protein